MSFINIGSIGINAIRRVIDLIQAGKAESLVDLTAPARVEPICLIEGNLVNYEGTPVILQSMTNLFAAYYLQGLMMMSSIGRIEVRRRLDRLNPNRSPIDSALNSAGWLLAREEYQNGLPTLSRRQAMEDLDSLEDEVKLQTGLSKRETLAQMKDLQDLSVGKLIEVEIIDGCEKVLVPVSIRLMASSVPTSTMEFVMTLDNQPITAVDRYWGVKDGSLQFVRDILMCDDLITAHRRNLMKDTDGFYREVVRRRNGNNLSTLLSGNPSIGKISNIILIDSETAAGIEGKLGGPLKSLKIREKVMNETSVMLLVVVDRGWERVTIYHKGIPLPTEIKISSMKSTSKGNGPDVTEILKAYQRAEAPSL